MTIHELLRLIERVYYADHNSEVVVTTGQHQFLIQSVGLEQDRSTTETRSVIAIHIDVNS